MSINGDLIQEELLLKALIDCYRYERGVTVGKALVVVENEFLERLEDQIEKRSLTYDEAQRKCALREQAIGSLELRAVLDQPVRKYLVFLETQVFSRLEYQSYFNRIV